MTFPFPLAIPVSFSCSSPASVDLSTGVSYFGDMTDFGGLAAAWDGDDTQDNSFAAGKNTASAAAYIGVDMGAGHYIYPTNIDLTGAATSGFAGSSITQLAWELRQADTMPTSLAEAQSFGTSLGSSGTIVDGGAATGSITPSGQTFKRYLWLVSSIVAGSNDAWLLAEAAVTGCTI